MTYIFEILELWSNISAGCWIYYFLFFFLVLFLAQEASQAEYPQPAINLTENVIMLSRMQ